MRTEGHELLSAREGCVVMPTGTSHYRLFWRSPDAALVNGSVPTSMCAVQAGFMNLRPGECNIGLTLVAMLIPVGWATLDLAAFATTARPGVLDSQRKGQVRCAPPPDTEW